MEPPEINNSKSTPTRTVALLVAVVALLAGIGLTGLVASKLGEYQRTSGRIIYAFSPVAEDTFSFAGRTVSLLDQDSTDQRPFGSVQLTYGDLTTDLVIPFQPRVHTNELPGLYPHEDWLRVLRFAPISGRSSDQLLQDIESGQVKDRLCVVARIPRPGADAETWGRIWRRDWTFEIHELLPDGTMDTYRLAYPQGRPYDETPPDEVGGLPTLKPGSWQHDAALHVMPQGSGPRIRIIDSALRSVGWPFAGAVIFVSIAVAGFIVRLVPTREDINRRIEASR
jgi:hypothetical protein